MFDALSGVDTRLKSRRTPCVLPAKWLVTRAVYRAQSGLYRFVLRAAGNGQWINSGGDLSERETNLRRTAGVMQRARARAERAGGCELVQA